MILTRRQRLTRRDLWLALLPFLLLVVASLALAVAFVRPAPPNELVLSTGNGEGSYQGVGKKYQEILARDGVRLILRPSEGSVDNLARLGDPDSGVAVGFIQGGTGFAANSPGLVSLGALYYEPLWVFYRGEVPLRDPGALGGLRIGVGAQGSGTRALALQLLALTNAVLPPTRLVDIGGDPAADALLRGELDAAMFIAPPEAELLQRLVATPGVHLMNLERAEALSRRFPYLTHLVLPAGVLDLARGIPPGDVNLVAPTANLVARADLHPALAYLLLRAATEVHAGPGLLEHAGEFPAAREAGFPLARDARRYYQSGTPLLQRYLPFWAATWVDRLWVVAVPLLALGIPVLRAIPPLYSWRVRSRIYKWYAKLKEVELELDDGPAEPLLQQMLIRLDQIEQAVSRVPTPPAYSDQLYGFRTHIELVRSRVRAALASRASSVVPPGAGN